MAVTVSGKGPLAGKQPRSPNVLPAARYAWPDDDALTANVVGSGELLIAVGLLPHPNEPLGSAFATTLTGYRGHLGRITLIGPIDPPPPEHRFPLPCDPVTFVAHGYLQRLPEQVEFAHCPDPKTPAQHRAAEFRTRLRELAPDILVLLHNDVGARAPYLYANSPWPAAERRLRDDLAHAFSIWEPLDASWTYRISERTYAFFPCDRIGVVGSESTGLYIERELGIPTLTVELPMFDWATAEQARLDVRTAVAHWISAGGTVSGDTPGLVRDVARSLTGHDITMVPPGISARVVWSVLEGLREDLE
jgi:hypothetical protein